MKITKKYLQKIIEQETKRAINERGPCKGTKRLHSDGKCYYPDEMPCRGTKVRHSDGKCYYPDEVPTKNGQATKQTNPCKGTKVLSKVDGKCYYPDELPDEKALNEMLPTESLKISRKKLAQTIKEEIMSVINEQKKEIF